MDLVRIRGLEIDCIVGVRPLEREREQRVHIELGLGLDLSPAGRSGRIGLTCDYDQIATEVIAMLHFRHYHLIEMATEEVAAMLLATHPVLELVEIRLDKPAALDGRARAASVEIQRRRAQYPTTTARTEYGFSELFLSTRDAELSLLRVTGGGNVPPLPASARALDWVVSGDIYRAGSSVAPHAPLVLGGDGAPHGYENRGQAEAMLFRCACAGGLP